MSQLIFFARPDNQDPRPGINSAILNLFQNLDLLSETTTYRLNLRKNSVSSIRAVKKEHCRDARSAREKTRVIIIDLQRSTVIRQKRKEWVSKNGLSKSSYENRIGLICAKADLLREDAVRDLQ